MKKISAILALLFLIPLSKARADIFDYGNRIISSYSEVATPGIVLMSSGAIYLTAVTISTPAANGKIVFFRSNREAFMSDIATQTVVDCSHVTSNGNNQSVPLFNVLNDSYTYVRRIGNCGATIWYIPSDAYLSDEGRLKNFGLPNDGLR